MSIDCVFFDAAGTLIEANPSVRTVYADVLRGRGYEVEEAEIGERFRHAWAGLREKTRSEPPYGTTEAEARQWWRRVVEATYERWDLGGRLDAVFEELWEHFARPEAWRVYPDVEPCFAQLRAESVGLGLISNWDVRLHDVLQGLGLWDLFDEAVISCDVGAEKPDRAIFRAALDRAQLSPEGALHVGDSREADLEGALNAGMSALLLQRDAGSDKADGEAIIHRLTEIPNRVSPDIS